jgi:hypothetical protein
MDNSKESYARSKGQRNEQGQAENIMNFRALEHNVKYNSKPKKTKRRYTKRYYYLKEGEVIKGGDEFQTNTTSNSWAKCTDSVGKIKGEYFTRATVKIRRKIESKSNRE